MDWIGNRRRWFLMTAAIGVAGLIWIFSSSVPADATTGGRIPSPREGFASPAFALSRLDGDTVALESLRGRPVIVNFWATWCPPCRAEMPALQRVYQDYEESGLEVLAVNATHQDSASAAASFAGEYDLGFPILLDTTGLVNNLYQVRALPTTFFVDRDGVIQQVIVGGPIDEITFRTAVESMLGQSE